MAFLTSIWVIRMRRSSARWQSENYRNNYKTLVLCIENSWSCLNGLESLSWLFLGFKGNQIQTLGMPQSKVAINQLFLFSVRNKKLWYPRGPTWSPDECGLYWQVYSRSRMEEGKAWEKPKGKVRQNKRENLRELLRVGCSEEERGPPLHRLVRIHQLQVLYRPSVWIVWSHKQHWKFGPKGACTEGGISSHSELTLTWVDSMYSKSILFF